MPLPMTAPEADMLTIPYGSAETFDPWGGVLPGVPCVRIDRRGRAALRLDGPGYPFAEPPDLVRLVTLEERLAFLLEHLKGQCGLWDRLPRLFLEAYFRWIAASIAAAGATIAAGAAGRSGLLVPRDWSFAALRPLPQAHLPTSGGPVRVDMAFWTGEALVAVEMVGNASRDRRRLEALERLRQEGAAVVEIAGSALQRDGVAALDEALPPPFHRFWEARPLPLSPFGAGGLDEIIAGPDA
jgi:hypothetical protein